MSNAPLKAISCILGYSSWYLLGNLCVHTTQVTVPLTFYNTQKKWTIEAPETISISLAGRRSPIRSLETKKLAIHVDGSTLQSGTQPITIATHQLFLPDSIKLVHYIPATITVTVTHNT